MRKKGRAQVMSKANSNPLDAEAQNTGTRRRFSGGGMRLSDTEAAEMRRRLIKPMKSEPDLERAPDTWDRLGSIPVKEAHLEEHRVISASRHNPAHVAFDVLRTRLVQGLAEKGWRRVVITSPTKDCGKTFISTNLAISLSRQERLRTVLMDLDLRNPSVAPLLGVEDPGTMGDFLRTRISIGIPPIIPSWVVHRTFDPIGDFGIGDIASCVCGGCSMNCNTVIYFVTLCNRLKGSLEFRTLVFFHGKISVSA